MRRQPRSENRKIVRKLCDTGEAGTVAEIGSRVFPFRAPPAPMPSVGTRRSTRVFVPKTAVAKPRDGPHRPLRSAKRLAIPRNRSEDGDEWLPLFSSTGGGPWWKPEEEEKGGLGVGWNEPVTAPEPDLAVPMFNLLHGLPEHNGTMIDIVYTRKRRRPSSNDSASLSSSKGRKYGIIYTRRCSQKTPLPEDVPIETGLDDTEHEDEVTTLEITESARNFAKMVAGISEADLCTALDDPVLLSVLVESSRVGSADLFSRIFISIISWMRRRSVGLWCFAAIIFSKSLAGVFSLHGVHFLPIQRVKMEVLLGDAVSGSGICKIYSAEHAVPLLSVSISALPLYFKSLHSAIFFSSQYLPDVLARYLVEVVQSEGEHNSHAFTEAGEVTTSMIPALENHELPCLVEASKLTVQNAVMVHNFRSQKPQKKKRKTRPRVDRNNIIVSLPATPYSPCNLLEPVSVKLLDAYTGDFYREDDDVSSPCGPLISKKFEGTKEMKLALAEVKQNIDSARCNANILVTESDRCWREEGAELMLEFSASKEWYIVVKVQGVTRYLLKPQEWRPCAVNRVTHDYMWGWEDGWKLEFFDKWDWSVFKELHMECRERNSQPVSTKIIPVPGVREVSGYDEMATPSFVRPNMYIHMTGDEIGRALASESASYDMDSGDEEWLKQLNSTSVDSEDNGLSHISENDFEKIIFALEKVAYNNPDDIPDKTRAVDLCQDLGRRDILAAAYDYWLRKRNKRRAPLVRLFQYPSSRRTQLLQKPYFRKKRSFSRQRSQSGRGKPDFFVQAGARQQEAIRRVQEAESAANRTVESAIHLRSRAQMFMENADLAVYKSVMALKIAEAKRVSESFDFSSILD